MDRLSNFAPTPSMKYMKRIIFAAALAAAGISMSAHAVDAKGIGAKLKSAFPEIPEIQAINPTPAAGLLEVVLPGEILYVDVNGDYMLQGNLVRLSDRRDLTTERLEHINRLDFAKLPLDKAIVHKYGKGERKLVVFADPNCSFCKRLEKEALPEVANATVYTFPYAILSEDSASKSKQILCSASPGEAWHAWMLKSSTPTTAADPKCEGTAQATVDAIRALGKQHGVRGTPTLVFEDGTRIPGFVPAATINQRLDETKS